MNVLASFEYHGPTHAAVVLGVNAATLLLFLIARSGNLRTGVWGGALGGAVITWLVLGTGRGDMDGMAQLIFSPLAAVGGAIAGGLGAIIVRRIHGK